MRKDKEIAFKMRKNGKSYNEIREALKIPKATLSGWFSEINWSKDIAKKLAASVQKQHTIRLIELDRIRGTHLKRAYEEAREEARKEMAELKYNPLFIAGLMLYWGEGDKSSIRNGVRIANTDPSLIKLYIFFLTRACKIPIERIKAHVLIYPDLDATKCIQYWAEASGLPESNFTKCTTIVGRHKTKRLGWGVCLVAVSSTYFKEKMLEWLKMFPSELMNKEYYESI
ncbi:MAG: hypothetical protein Q7K40_02760 [bacterium]|nr:hypothetical protein [bacterium]